MYTYITICKCCAVQTYANKDLFEFERHLKEK